MNASSKPTNSNGPTLLHLKILTPSMVFYDGLITSIKLSDHNGQIMFFKDYYPFITRIISSIVTIVTYDNKVIQYIIDDGFLSVSDNSLFLMVSFCIENNRVEKDKILSLRKKNISILEKRNVHHIKFDIGETQILQKLYSLNEEKKRH